MNKKKYKHLGIVICLALLLEGMAGLWSTSSAAADPLPASGTLYYVSQSTGDDSYDGLAPEWDGVHGPWQTLGKVSERTYAEGDTISLKRGDEWNEQLTLRGSGTEASPITVTAYGGAGNRPYIYRNLGVDEEVIRIDNGDGYTIEGLEIANARRGIRIIADGNTKPRFQHYRIQDNYFRNIVNINGSLPGEEGTTIDLVTVPGVKPVFADITIKNNIFRKTEISYIMWSDGTSPRQEDVRIEGSTFIENGRNQVFQWSGKNVDIIDNLFYYNYPWKYFGVGLTSVLTEHLTGEPGVYNEVDGNEFGWSGTYPGDHDGTAYDFEKSGDYIHFTNNFVHDSYRYGVMFMGGQTFNELRVADNIFKDNPLGTMDSPYHIWLRADNGGSGEFTGNKFYNAPGITGFHQKPASFTYANNADPATYPGFAAMPFVTEIGVPSASARTYTFHSATWGSELRYTLDGSVPKETSLLYTGPVTVTDKSAVVNVKAFVAGMHPSKTNMVLADFRDNGEGEGPAHWWKLDESSGSVAADTAGGADGAVTGGAWTSGMIDGGLAFDGLGGGVEVNDAALAAIADNFTMAFWVKPAAAIVPKLEAGDGITGDNGQRYAIAPSYRGGGGNSSHAGVGVSVGTNGISVVEHSDMYLPSLLTDEAIAIDPGAWTHIAVVYKNKQPWLYVDGTFRKAGYTSTKTVHPSADIGGSGLGWFDGLIDDVRIYDRPLAVQELQILSYPAHEPELPEFASQWRLFNSPITATPHPTEVELEDDAIVFSGDGFYTISEGEVESANGAVLDRPIQAESFSMVFTPKELDGDMMASEDAWLAIALLDSQRYFNVLKPEQARGIVVLLRQSNGQLVLEPYKLDDAGFQAQTHTTLASAALNTVYELKLVQSGGVWKLMIDDTELDGDYSDIVNGVLNGEAYPMIGMSDTDGGRNGIAVHSVNGEIVYGARSVPEWRDGFLTATGVGAEQATLSWGGAEDREGIIAGYRIYRDGTELAAVDGSVGSYAVTGLTPATRYAFRVEAGNASGQWSSHGPAAQVTTDYALPDNMDFAADWQLYTGRAGEEERPTEARLGSNGIVLQGSGYYTVAEGRVVPANGAVFRKPVDTGRFMVRFTPEVLAGSLSAGDDSWLAVSLMSGPGYFDVLRPEAGQGIVVLLRDTAGELTVQPHKLTEASGFQAMPELTLDAPTLQQHELKLTQSGGLWRLSVNGIQLDGDYSDIVNNVLEEKAYVQIGLSDKRNLQNRIRVHAVNDSAAYLPQWEERAMKPFWLGDVMYDESLLMVASGGGEPAEAALLFEPTEMVSVRHATMDTVYREDIDWELADGKLRVLPGSAIPTMTEAELYPDPAVPGQSVDRKGGGAVLLQEGSYFHERQIVVTYRHDGEWQGPVPTPQYSSLPRTFGKLSAGEPLKLLVLGDSIATGANASGITNAPPYLPDWAVLLKRSLESRYGSAVELINRSKPGETSLWGVQEAEAAAAAGERSDLVVVAFGMNDGVGSDALFAPALYRGYVEDIMAHFREANDEAEFILVGTTLANPETYFDGKQASYMAELNDLAEAYEGTATADMTGVHSELLRHKKFRDMTGNNVNHPNDFLVRWYAQTLTGMLVSYSNADLVSLRVNGSAVAGFSPETLHYEMQVPHGVAAATIQAEAADSAAAIAVTGAGSLQTGVNTITVQVTAQDGSTRSYTVVIRREAAPGGGSGSGGPAPPEQEVGSDDVKPVDQARASELLARAQHPASVKLTLAGEIVQALLPSGDGSSPAYKLELAYDRSSNEDGLAGIYYWNEQHLQWEYVRSFRNVDEGKLIAAVNRSGFYGVLRYEQTFGDVSARHWAHASIRAMSAAQLVQGVSETRFNPERHITRAEWTAMLTRLTGVRSDASVPAPFSDVTPGSWQEQAVTAAYRAGIVQGDDQGRFLPDKPVSRQEMAVMLMRACQSAGCGTLPIDVESQAAYADEHHIAGWASTAVGQATGLGLLQGYGSGEFAPDRSATRAQAAAVMARLMHVLPLSFGADATNT